MPKTLIARKRFELDLSQFELAARVGVNRATVSRWERGLRHPNGELLAALAEALEVEPEQLARHRAA